MKELIDKLNSGQLSALDEIFKLYKDKIYRKFTRLSGNDSVADDLVQDVMYRLMIYVNNGNRIDYTFTNLLYSICHTVWMQFVKNNIEHHNNLSYELMVENNHTCGLTEDDHLDDLLDRNTIQIKFWEAVDELTDSLKQDMYLRYYIGMTNEEVAKMNNKTIDGVKKSIFRARKQLKKKLDGLL